MIYESDSAKKGTQDQAEFQETKKKRGNQQPQNSNKKADELMPGEEPEIYYVDLMLEGITKYAFMKRLCGLASTM